MNRLTKRLQGAAALALFTLFGMPAAVLAEVERTVPSIFAATNIQGNDGDDSLVVFNVVYFFHDGTFDAFDVGARASDGVAAIAHGATFARTLETFVPEFRASQPDGFISAIDHGLNFSAPEFQLYHAKEQRLDPRKHRYLSYLAKVFPSDDAFIGNDNPRAHEVFDENGVFQGPVVIELYGSDILDAGTRLNDEIDIPAFDAFPYPNDQLGVPTDDVIRPHPGFNGSLGKPDGEPRILGGTAQYVLGTDGQLHQVDPVLGDFTRPDFGRLNRFRLTSRLSGHFSGAWYNHELEGEGFLINIFDAAAPKLSLVWFTYEPDASGRQKWLVGSGPIDWRDAEVELFETDGGTMASPQNPEQVNTRRWGTAKVGFGFCDFGAVVVEPDDPSLPRATIPIKRLTSPPPGTERDCGGYSLDASNATPHPFPNPGD